MSTTIVLEAAPLFSSALSTSPTLQSISIIIVAVQSLLAFALELVRDEERHVRHGVGQVEEERAFGPACDEVDGMFRVPGGERAWSAAETDGLTTLRPSYSGSGG